MNVGAILAKVFVTAALTAVMYVATGNALVAVLVPALFGLSSFLVELGGRRSEPRAKPIWV